MFVAVDRTHAESSVTRPPRPRADALTRRERGPLRFDKPLSLFQKSRVRYRAIPEPKVPHNPQKNRT